MDHLVDGLFLGGLYTCVALGLTLVFGVMRLVNLAHGELLIGSAYLTFVVSSGLGLDPLASLVLTAPAVFVLGYGLQRLLLNPLLRHGMEPPLVATFGVSIAAQTALVLAFTANPKSLDASYAVRSLGVLGEPVRVVLVVALGAAVVLVAGTHLGLTRSRFGKALRAAAEDAEAASSIGVDVRHVYATTFAIAAVLAAVGGALIALAFSMTPSTGLGWLLRAFTVIVLGGMGSVWGSLGGGLIVGIAEELGSAWAGPEYRDLIVFSLLVLILVVRPQGLFGRKLTLTTAGDPRGVADPAAVGKPIPRATADAWRAHLPSIKRYGRWAGLAVVIALLFSGPAYLSTFDIVLAFTLLTLMAMAQAWNLIGGYAGLFSLGHHMFVGVGAYTTAVLLVRTELPLGLTVPLAGLVACALGALAALPLLRLRGVYFAVGSLGVALAAQAWFVNWGFTNKSSAYSLPSRAFLDFETQYYMAAGLALATTACVALVARTRFGLRLMAIRDDEDAAAELGVRGLTVKLAAFTLSAFFVGVAGALVAVQKLTLEPFSAFSLTFTINMIVMTVIGGMGTVTGPLVGAAVVFAIQQRLEDYGDWSTLMMGLLLIAIIRLAPGGLWGLSRGAGERLAGSPAARRLFVHPGPGAS